jgi:hypothetical protein
LLLLAQLRELRVLIDQIWLLFRWPNGQSG